MAAKRDFTDRGLKAIRPAPAGKRVIIYDAAVPGFGIRVTDRSRDQSLGSFVLVTRFPGNPNPTARQIGDYPAMTLAKAREIAREWREDIRQGIDPKAKEQARQREDARRRAGTFEVAFEAFAEDHLSTLRTGAAVKAVVVRHVIPWWGDRPLTEIKRVDVNELVRLVSKGAPITANRVLAYLKTFFSWCIDQDMLEASPAASVKRPAKEQKRDRVLTDDEIAAIWTACGGLGTFGRAFRLMLLTGQRRSEVGAMAWTEIDAKEKIWTLGRERTKADRAHTVPLSELAWSVIEECPRLNEFVFSTGRSAAERNGGGATPISGWAKSKARLARLALVDGQPIPEWHLHDLRRTCATNLAKLGTDRIVISKILNHAETGVTGVYDRFRYDAKKRTALEFWCSRLASIVAGNLESQRGGNIVALSSAREAVHA